MIEPGAPYGGCEKRCQRGRCLLLSTDHGRALAAPIASAPFSITPGAWRGRAFQSCLSIGSRYAPRPLKPVYVLFFIAAMWLIQCLVGGTRPVYCLPAYALLALAGGLSVFSFGRPIPRPDLRCLWVSAVFFAYVLLRAALSPVEYLAWMDFYMVLGCLVVYLLTALYISSSRLRMIVILGLLVLAAAEVGVGLRQFQVGDEWMPFGLPRATGGSRASGMFISPIHLAGFLEVVGAFAVSFTIWSAWRPWARILMGYGAVLCYGGVAITGSRGGYLSTACSLVAFTVISLWALHRVAPHRFRGAVFVATVALLVSLGAGFVVIKQDVFLSARLDRLFGDAGGTRDVRIYNWQATLDQFRVAPVVGTGAGTHLYYGRLFRRPEIQADPEHAHNDYLELLAEYGIIGLIGMTAFLFFHLRSGVSGLRENTDPEVNDPFGSLRDNRRALQIGALTAISAYLAHSVTDFNLHVPGNALMFAFIFGITANPNGRTYEASATGRGTRIFQMALPALSVWILISGGPKFRGEYWSERARAALYHRQPAQAVEFARKATQDQPPNPFTYNLLATAYARLAAGTPDPREQRILLEASLAASEHALALFPYDENTLAHMARTLDRLKRFQEARAAYEKAIELDPRLGSLRAYFARHLALVGRLEEAEAQLAKAHELGSARDPRTIVQGTPLDVPAEE